MTAENAMDIVISLEGVQETLRVLAEKMERNISLRDTPEDLKKTIGRYVEEIGWIIGGLRSAEIDVQDRKFKFERKIEEKIVEC